MKLLHAEKYTAELETNVRVHCHACGYIHRLHAIARGEETRVCHCGAHFVVAQLIQHEGINTTKLIVSVERRIVHGQPNRRGH